ncbi:MAG: hypothetical protein KKB31_07715 [Nanoarchaeota archaeon]|nr:hypothetical protein [Nanoarchaeota archaeon]
MKKFIVLPLLLIFLIGCAGIQLKQEVTDVIVTMAARRLAYELAKQDQSIIRPGIIICDTLMATEDLKKADEVTAYAIAKLSELIGNDPLLKQDLTDLLSLVEIKITGPPNLPKLKNAAAGFKTGLLMAERK